MYEEIRPGLSESFKKPTRQGFAAFKALELTHGPGHERVIDVSQQRGQRRRSIAPVVAYPAPKERIELAGDVLQRQLRLPS